MKIAIHSSTPVGSVGSAGRRRGFTIIELLVVVSVLLALMTLIGGAVSAARAGSKRSAAETLVARLNVIIQRQFSSYASRSVPVSAAGSSAARAAYLRKLASAEMPDSWEDVKLIVEDARRIDSGLTGLIFGGTTMTSPQRAYASIYTSSTAAGKTPSAMYADAECLFMIVMSGGIADCLDCGPLKSTEKGDTDGDGALEFLDTWGNPIRYVLWPAALELPPGAGRFFSTTAPFAPGTPQFAKGGTMRPLIFSCGPDTIPSIQLSGSDSKQNNLFFGDACGDPANVTVATFGGRDDGKTDGRADNITNFDAEASR